jgi:NAD(P)H-nitrite reductase large subunit
MESYKYVIIGNSAAGIGTCEGIRRVDREGTIAVISDEDMPAYCRCLTSYFIGGKVTEDGLLFRPRDYYQKNNIKPILGAKVVRISPAEDLVELEDGRKIAYSQLMLGLGASPVLYDVPGKEKQGVYVLRTYEDAKKISHAAKPGMKAAVLGGGLVGLKSADALHHRGVEVWVIVTSPQIMSQTMDKDGADILRRQLEENGLHVMTEKEVVEIVGKDRAEGVKLKNGEVLPAEIVIFAKGVRPNVKLAKDAGIDCDYGISVDAHMRTSVKNIYSAGDVAEAKDFISGGKYIHAIWPNAIEQGIVAGKNMAGENVEYEGGIAMNSVDLFGLPSIAVGHTRVKKDSGFEVISLISPEHRYYRKIVLKDNVIVGSVCIGCIESAGVFSGLIRKRADVTKIREAMLRDDFDYAKVVAEGVVQDKEHFIKRD